MGWLIAMHTIRIFADHYQFYVYDSSDDHYSDDRLDWKKNEKEPYGYMRTERAIYVSTVADLNDHRVRIYPDELPTQSYERMYTTTIDIPSGKLIISAPANGPDEDFILPVPPGEYDISICSNAIGKDMLSYPEGDCEEMNDEDYLTHDDFEYYDIYLTKSPS
jgi:hypothetical protein